MNSDKLSDCGITIKRLTQLNFKFWKLKKFLIIAYRDVEHVKFGNDDATDDSE